MMQKIIRWVFLPLWAVLLPFYIRARIAKTPPRPRNPKEEDTWIDWADPEIAVWQFLDGKWKKLDMIDEVEV